MIDLSNLSVGIDGMNLALPKGTGVSTYARSLAKTLHSAQTHIDLLYGITIKGQLNAAIFSKNLLDDYRRKRPKFFHPAFWLDITKNYIGQDAFSIDIKAPEIEKLYGSKLPYCDRILNVSNVFEKAHRFFKITHRFLKVKITPTPQIMHWTYPIPIEVIGAKNVYTLHDLVPLMMPETTLDNERYYYDLIHYITKWSDAIVTVSESSKKDILSFFPKARPIFNLYQVLLYSKYEMLNISRNSNNILKEKFNLKHENYFIFYGQLEPKKNIGRLIQAFLSTDSKRSLVIIGSNGWNFDKEDVFLKKGISSGRVKHLDYLPINDLFLLTRHARALLFPSIAEGFGLPLLEAFSLGTPVMTSNHGALKEISGESAMLVDAYNISSIKEGIEYLDNNDDLCYSLKRRGFARYYFFSEEPYKKRLQTAYNTIIR